MGTDDSRFNVPLTAWGDTHFNVSLTRGAKSHDSVHKQLGEEKGESKLVFEPRRPLASLAPYRR